MAALVFLTSPVPRSRPSAKSGPVQTSPLATNTSAGERKPGLDGPLQRVFPSAAERAVSFPPSASSTTPS